MTPREAGARARRVLGEIERAVVGKPDSLELVMLGVLAGGHILIEDLPGLGKTLLARSFATALGLDFRRIQFTPDLLPSDVSGAPFYDQRSGEMVFRPGPLFTHLLLADEINRTPPKTQAALLEAMAEAQVSVDGVTRRLPEPFVVIATANPIEYEGTYSLPEAQLDRFLLRVRMGYLPPADEASMLRTRLDRATPEAVLDTLSTPAEVLAMRASLESVEVDDDLIAYVVALIGATRAHPQIQVGASPRGGLALVQLARARAVLDGRDYVTPEDVKALVVPALAHRVTLRPELWVRQINADDVIAEVARSVAAPQTLPADKRADGGASDGTHSAFRRPAARP
ncbi:MoxR family ATPase [Streptomyces sp. SPB162]|uniref:AAA family ATPase n=1 Tax=Streptomyces sp. SPB162 TaxID=2940560 RepID=UPI002406F372|nr:MoxR family ATPase [Streptomyces sp. SPB162]